MNNPSNSIISNQFLWLYDVINVANNIIHQADREDIDWINGSVGPEENKNRVIGESRAIRAWAYRHLTYLHGDVPLVLEPTSGQTIRTDWIRTPIIEIREQMVEDLLFAEQYVPSGASLPGRMTKGAVQHFLAETYLLLGDYDRAVIWTDEVINNSDYQLMTERFGVRADRPGSPFMDMFYAGNMNREEGNLESLWVFQFAHETIGGGNNPRIRRRYIGNYTDIEVDGVYPLVLTQERGGGGTPEFSLTKWALELYEEDDDRGKQEALRRYFILNDAFDNDPQIADNLPPGWAYGDTLHLDWSGDLTPETKQRPDWPYLRKYEQVDPTNVNNSNYFFDQIYLRLAETYLLKAEAQCLLGNFTGAAETVNIIRKRANASEISPDMIDIDFILDERARELATEEHRRYTLLRHEKWIERTRLYNRNGGQLIADRDRYFPIPQIVIDANLTGDLPQNPGY